jgi:L-ascorbate metabolism protein UlaG (beta-lactamase superfamily)
VKRAAGLSRRSGLRVATAVLGVLALAALGGVAWLQHPQFGKQPDGEHLARIVLSPHYSNGAFRNRVDTPMLTTDQSRLSLMLSNAFGEKSATRPPGPLPTVRTDLRELDVSQDLVVWLGHSSYFVQLAGQRILVDPVFSTNASPVPGTNRAFDGTSLYTADDMPDIDVLLITHDHYDHLDYPSIRALQPRVRQVIVGLGVGAHFEVWGYDMRTVREADWGAVVVPTPQLQIHVAPARHYSGRTFSRDRSLWVGYALISPERRLFFSGDSGYGPHFAEIGERLGPFDWAGLDAGQYDPRWAYIHMNPEQAAQAAEDLRAKALTPAHAGRFSISPHAWDDPFKRIAAASSGRAYALWTPEIGRPVHLDGRAQAFSHWWEAVR